MARLNPQQRKELARKAALASRGRVLLGVTDGEGNPVTAEELAAAETITKLPGDTIRYDMPKSRKQALVGCVRHRKHDPACPYCRLESGLE